MFTRTTTAVAKLSLSLSRYHSLTAVSSLFGWLCLLLLCIRVCVYVGSHVYVCRRGQPENGLYALHFVLKKCKLLHVCVWLCVHLSFFNDRSCTHTRTHTHMRRECRFILGSSMTSSETFSSTLRPSSPSLTHTPPPIQFIYVHALVSVCVYVCNYVLQFLTVVHLCHIYIPYVFAINAFMWNSTRLIKKLRATLIDMKRRQFECEFQAYFSDRQAKGYVK